MSTTAYEVDDLENVAFGHRARCVVGARNDFAVQLDRNRAFGEPQLHDDLTHRLRVADVACFAIHDELH